MSPKKGPYITAFLTLCVLWVISAMPARAQTLGRTTEIQVREDGSAIWVIENKIPLGTSDNAAQQMASEFEAGWRSGIENAEVLTGRSMELKNFDATGPVQIQDYKVMRYQFEWVGFAKLEGDRITIGDVFGAGVLNLSAVDILYIRFPAGYAASNVVPAATQSSENTLMWSGPKSFAFGEPHATFTKLGSIWPKVILVVVISACLVLGWLLWHKRIFRPLLKTAAKPAEPAESLVLKSDVERAVDILKAAGGKMQQTELVKRMDLSKSKVSAILGSMEAAGKIQRTRMGRKNLVALKPGADEKRFPE